MRRTVLIAAALLGTCTMAVAADFKAPQYAPPASGDSFYLGILGVAGGTNIDGIPSPVSFGAGLVGGWSGTVGMWYYGGSIEILDNSSNSVATGYNSTFSNNGLLLQEGGEFGLNLGRAFGSQGITASYPWYNLTLAARFGAAQINTDTCSGGRCNSNFVDGWYGGLKLKAMLTSKVEAFAVYDHIQYDATVLKSMDLYKLGAAYHFAP